MAKRVLLMAIIAMQTFIGWSETEVVNGIEWTYTVTDGKASVGGGSYSKTAVPKTTSGEITIPSTLGGYSVTSIGDYAFCSCVSLMSVTIPDSVTTIGDYAFDYCKSLASITIPDSVTTIGDYAFDYCKSLASITIGKSVTSIGNYAFESCSSLTSVTIPDGVTSIGDYAFEYCFSLEIVTIPNSVTSIGAYAFGYCTSLTSAEIPDSVISIADSAFTLCYGLADNNGFLIIKDILFGYNGAGQEVVIPSNVKSIGPYAFYNAENLMSVEIPDSVVSISDAAFTWCQGLADSNGFVIIKDILFGYYGDEEEVEIPRNVRRIGSYVFINNTEVSVIIPDSVTSIGDYAFSDCFSLERVTIPSSVTNIGTVAFSGCSSLMSVTIPDSVTSIGDYAFYDCANLAKVSLPIALKEQVDEGYVFDGCSDDLEIIWREWKYTVIDGCVFITKYLGLSDVVEIPATIDDMSVTGIGYGAFKDKPFVEEVIIPKSVTKIDRSAFEGTSFGDKVYTEMFKAAADSLVSGGNSTPLNASLALTVTNVVVHFVTQSLPSDAVIPTTTSGIVNVITEVNSGSAIAITEEWSKQYEGFVSKFGDNFTAAITAKTGKYDGAGKPMMVWQDFVAGTDPTDPNDTFKASITFDKDTNEPIISWTPELSEIEAAKRSYKVFGKIKLTDKNWTLISGNASDYNFFKVTVEMR